MRRHLTGIGLAIVMVLAMFFPGAWGYVRLLRLPAAAGSSMSALPAQGGSLLSSTSVLAALAAMAGAAVLAGILIAAPRISALAAGLPGLLAIAWQALYVLSVHRAVGIIPLRSHAFGAGWEALLFNGTLGAAGLAMIIPLFVPSRWRGRGARGDDLADADVSEATGYMADLKATMAADGPSRHPAEAVPAGAAATRAVPTGGMPTGGMPTGGMPGGAAPTRGVPTRGVPTGGGPGGRLPVGWTRRGGGAPTAGNPVPGSADPTRPSRTGLVGGPNRASNPMRPRPYRRPADDQ